MAAFRMSKWYLDTITESCDVFIGYTGSVGWGMLRVRHASLLGSCGDETPTITRPVLRSHSGVARRSSSGITLSGRAMRPQCVAPYGVSLREGACSRGYGRKNVRCADRGIYSIGSGVSRFVEGACRGEP